MTSLAIVLVTCTFVASWFFCARSMAAMGPWMRHLMALPVAFVAAFCVMAMLFFIGVARPG